MSNAYFEDGARRAMGLGNRGPIRFNKDGSIHNDILDAYWRNSFYVLEGVVSRQELQELRD